MGRRSRSPYAVLGLVAQASKSGYDISRMFERARFLFWNESYGQIYPALKKLHDSDLVEQKQEEREVGPTKKIYTLTQKGEEELARWLRRQPGTTSMRDEVALRVTYGEHTNSEIIRALLEQERARVTALKKDLEKEDLEELNAYEKMGYDWAERYIEMREGWVEQCLSDLDQVPEQSATSEEEAPAKKTRRSSSTKKKASTSSSTTKRKRGRASKESEED